MSQSEAFFDLVGDELVPRPEARGPWSPDMLHGRLLAGLAGRAVEATHGDEDLQVARLTVDLFRSPPIAPVRVSTRRVRDGSRVRAVDASVEVGGTEVARASALMLRRATQPEGKVWSAPEWLVPSPDEIDPPARPGGGGATWDTRPITPGGFGTVGQKRMWLREARPLVAGEPLTPFVRAAVAADFANPFANSGERGLQFINADLTLYLRRLPRSDWLGFEVTNHLSEEGVAVGECAVYDVEGRVGTASVCAVANERRPIRRSP